MPLRQTECLGLRGGCQDDAPTTAGESGQVEDVNEDTRKIKEGLKGLALPRNLLRKYGDGDLDVGDAEGGMRKMSESNKKDQLDAALTHAASQGDELSVKDLLREGARVDSLYIPPLQEGEDVRVQPSGCMPLHAAAENGSTAVAQLLLQRGAPINACDRDGATALHRAAYWGQHEMIGLLLEHGADPSACDHDLMTPLHNAAIRGMSQVARGLMAAGSPVDAGDESGDTSLHLACLYGHIDTVKALLSYNASVNARNKDNLTALHNAAAFGHSQTAAILLEAGTHPANFMLHHITVFDTTYAND
jgi:ankyrin repeat protein